MFGLGFGELVIIALATLIFYGPNKLPEFMRLAGRLFVQLRRMSGEVKDVVETVIKEAEKEMALEEAQKTKAQETPAMPAKTLETLPESIPSVAAPTPAILTSDLGSGFEGAFDLSPNHQTPADRTTSQSHEPSEPST